MQSFCTLGGLSPLSCKVVHTRRKLHCDTRADLRHISFAPFSRIFPCSSLCVSQLKSSRLRWSVSTQTLPSDQEFRNSFLGHGGVESLRKKTIFASSADIGADNYGEKSGTGQPEEYEVSKLKNAAVTDLDKEKGSLRLAGAVAALVGIVTVVAVAVTLASGGPKALVDAIAKSGFTAAFALIFVSEIGDKTFFIAALLAMQHTKSLVLLGSTAALAIMTIISVVIGRIFHAVPAQLKTTLPIGEYAAVALLLFFGFKSIKQAWDLPTSPTKNQGDESSGKGELAEAEEFIKKSEVKKTSTPFEILGETFSLVFLAEWGDRSMLATIALGAAQSPWGVATGAIAGHVVATALAVAGGAFLAQYISEKVVGYIGGFLFLAFSAATLLGAF